MRLKTETPCFLRDDDDARRCDDGLGDQDDGAGFSVRDDQSCL